MPLPRHIEELLTEKIQVDIRIKGLHGRNLHQQAAMRALKSGSYQPQIIAVEYSDEIGRRAELIEDSIRHVLGEVKLKPYEGLVDDLIKLFDAQFDKNVNELKPKVMEGLKAANITGGKDGGLSEKVDNWRLKHRMEIKILGSAIMEPARQSNVTTFSIHNSQVGAIQTGEGSRVGTGIKIDAQGTERLLKAIADVKNSLSELTALGETKRTELREVAVEVESELKKGQPNSTRLGGLLSTILASIQGIQTLKEAYDTISGCLGAFGVEVQ